MKEDNSTDKEQDPEKDDNQLFDKAEETFIWRKNLSTINAEDPIPVSIVKKEEGLLNNLIY